ESMSGLSFTMVLLGSAAVAALLLAAVGLYGVLGYLVQRRTSEIGVRIALGAQPAQVERMIVGGSLRFVLAGVVLGVALAVAAGRVLESMLFGVAPTQPAAYATAIAVLVGVALAASWLPARRASHVEPVVALRAESGSAGGSTARGGEAMLSTCAWPVEPTGGNQMPFRNLLLIAALVLAGCTAATSPSSRVDETRVRMLLTSLAHDSMQGRRAGTESAAQAARFIAHHMEEIGLTPAGDSAFHQRVFAARVQVNGRRRMMVVPDEAALDTVPESDRIYDANVVGVIRGSDPALRDEAIVVGAHFDHIGIIEPVDGDSIANGADDDASGVVAVLEIAR